MDGFAQIAQPGPSLAAVRLTQLFPRDGVLDFLFFKLPYILRQFSFVFVAFIFERFYVIVVPCFEAVPVIPM